MWMPAMALGDSMSSCAPWHASHEDMSRSSSHARNWGQHRRLLELTFCKPSLRNDTVNMPLSTQSRMSSAGSPPMLSNPMPC